MGATNNNTDNGKKDLKHVIFTAKTSEELLKYTHHLATLDSEVLPSDTDGKSIIEFNDELKKTQILASQYLILDGYAHSVTVKDGFVPTDGGVSYNASTVGRQKSHISYIGFRATNSQDNFRSKPRSLVPKNIPKDKMGELESELINCDLLVISTSFGFPKDINFYKGIIAERESAGRATYVSCDEYVLHGMMREFSDTNAIVNRDPPYLAKHFFNLIEKGKLSSR